jgi:hypothetical protein
MTRREVAVNRAVLYTLQLTISPSRQKNRKMMR